MQRFFRYIFQTSVHICDEEMNDCGMILIPSAEKH